MEDPTRYPGIGPSTVQPQHIFDVSKFLTPSKKEINNEKEKNLHQKAIDGFKL
jgi:hypothetical protein